MRLGPLALVLVFLVTPASGIVPGATRADLPAVAQLHLRHLEETYRILDLVAEKIWPGWTTYRETPFLLEYPNGLRVMVGHPNPPAAEFEWVDGVHVEGKKVAIDRRRLLPIQMAPPLAGGGGVVRYGTTANGESVEVVRIGFRVPARPSEGTSDDGSYGTEEQVLLYVHELFHCFQRTRFAPSRFGNLRFNADVESAVWSDVEGLALEAAYLEQDETRARERVKDFLVARDQKRRTMTPEQQGEESSDDVLEGTATYATVRAIEVLAATGFSPGLTAADDPHYGGFRDTAALLESHAKALRAAIENVEDPKMKCYDYGSFQGLLAQRLFPGWQKAIEEGGLIDAEMRRRLPMDAAEVDQVKRRLVERYPVEAIRARVTGVLEPRDRAWRAVTGRTGRTYVIDVKATRQFIDTVFPSKAGYRLGIGKLFPSGSRAVRFDDVEWSAVEVPFETAQLYYVRMVHESPAKGAPAYVITGQKQPDGSYLDATVTTPLFTLKAPRVSVHEGANRVKVKVLSRVKGG